MSAHREVIVVRSLTDSDLGLFAAHRSAATSKQRAININAPAAARLLSPSLYEAGGAELDCICSFEDIQNRSPRAFLKVHKNWRLGGNKLEESAFGKIDSSDFVLIRSPLNNDGSAAVSVTFISRASDRVTHARVSQLVAGRLVRSVLVIEADNPIFSEISSLCLAPPSPPSARPTASFQSPSPKILPQPPLMPPERKSSKPQRTIQEKLRSPHIIEQMMKVSGDMSAPAQLQFLDTVEQLASQLRTVLINTGRIIKIEKDHKRLWGQVAGQSMGFVDGGMANLTMLGSAPIAVRVGGYIVTPGDETPEREQFIVLKKLISELYAAPDGSVYRGAYPDVGALRDAARISVEAAGGARILEERPDVRWVFLHGALVNPVSRYTDIMRDGKPAYHFPDFAKAALAEILPPGTKLPTGRDANFVSVYLHLLKRLQESKAVVCSVVERESHTTTVIKETLSSLDDQDIKDFLPLPPAKWKEWFLASVDPMIDDDVEGQRITDPLLFRCILEPGEALVPVSVNRNDMRRAPKAWGDVISEYPRPIVSYLQPSEWNAPIRLEMFEKDRGLFADTASLVFHCAQLLPRYAFPVGLDIVDKFAKIPDWMSKPVNTHTAVQTLKRALDRGDTRLFDGLRRMMCGSQREWLFRPGILR